MRSRLIVWLTAAVLAVGAAGASAQQTGEIYGRVNDTSGAVLPGVVVTLTSPVLLRPLTATTSDSGSYRFPQLQVGTYTVKFELTGFQIVIKEGVRVEIGLSAQVNQTLGLSTLEETVSVTAETSLVDTKDTGRTSRFTQEALQNIPSARDPWVILEQSAGVAMDRQNVGGSASGQQSNFVARGAAMSQQKWNLDGVDITDMSATGGSPVYFDFDAFEEMQISTGGADVTMQSPGVGVNLVTKSGTDKLRGSGRYYITDEKFQSVNVSDEQRRQGASTGNPIQNIKDYGIEAGGPIVKGRAWIWGSYGKQNISVGVNNFYLASAECQAMKAAPLTYSLEEIRKCLSPDTTLLNNYNLKYQMQTFRNNQASMFFNAAEKVRNARDASDVRPLETTWRQLGVTRTDLGSSWWKTGMPKSYKWTDRHIFSDRLMMEGSYSHVGNNFALTFHEESLRGVQATYEISTGLWGRSYQEAVYVRPTDSIDFMTNYFLPNTLGGDHALKVGFKIRNDIAHTESMWGGDAYARFNRGVAAEAQLYRRGLTEYGLRNRNFFVQDTWTRGRFVINLGLRFDYQTDFANEAKVDASPFYGKTTYAGEYNGVSYPGAVFNQLPAVSFAGAKAGVAFKNWSPRLGLTYDITDDGRNVVKLNYSRYVEQLGTGSMSSAYNTVVATTVRYPWVDVNGDKVVQANEVVLTAAPLQWTGGYDYNNPSATSTSGKVDPGVTASKTDEFIVTFDRQFGNQVAISASYIWRNYGNFWGTVYDDFGPSDWAQASFTPPASTCPSGATCPTVTYYVPTRQLPTKYTLKNISDFHRNYQGFELTGRKRFADRWQLNGSYSYNDAPLHFETPQGYYYQSSTGDPTSIESSLNKGQYAPESTSSGLGNVFVNTKWILRLSGSYTLPLHINVAAFYNTRGGYPFIRSVLTPTRPFSAGQATVYLDKRGDERLPNFQTMDFRVDRVFTLFNRARFTASVDIFNLFNGSTTQSMRGRQNASNANTISSLLAPRVLRFGVRATF